MADRVRSGRPVLVGYRGSGKGSDAVLEQAVAAAESREVPLHVVRVLVEPLAMQTGQLRQQQTSREQVRAELELLRERLGTDGALAELVVTTSQTSSDVLLQEAVARDAGLLVIGLRQRSRVGKVILGSTAQQLLLGADCPVLAVPVGQE